MATIRHIALLALCTLAAACSVSGNPPPPPERQVSYRHWLPRSEAATALQAAARIHGTFGHARMAVEGELCPDAHLPAPPLLSRSGPLPVSDARGEGWLYEQVWRSAPAGCGGEGRYLARLAAALPEDTELRVDGQSLSR